MKKNYFFTLMLTFCIGMSSFGQMPIITMIVDGDCSGGTPKLFEIYAQGTVDFTLYSIENQTNSNTTWANTQSLAAFGTVTNGFVYVVSASDLTILNAEYPSLSSITPLVSGTVNLNGDDRIRIVRNSDSAVIDQYGAEGIDGSGTDWEWKDGYAKRNNGTSPNGGTFNSSNWTNANGELNGKGTCQSGSTFESISGIGTFTMATASLKDDVIKGFTVYPNPVKNSFVTIGTAANTTKTIQIFNVLGKKVFSETFTGTQKRINMSSISTGIYLMKVIEGDKIAIKKLIVN